MNSTEAIPFETRALDDFYTWYGQIHGYVSLAVCATGIPMNIINIVVLTRKNMQTPINFILTWLAVSDIATMMSYAPFAIHFYIQHSKMSAAKNSLGWMRFLLVHLNFSGTTHTISIWLGVALAIFRHVHIHSPAKGNLTRIRRLIRARLVVFSIFLGSVVVMVPSYASYKLLPYNFSDNTTGYIFDNWRLGYPDVEPLVVVGLTLYGIIGKFLPCILIIIYGGLLLRTVNHKLKLKRRRMSENGVTIVSQRSMDTSRTTVMLLSVIVLFLLTELPQAILVMGCFFKGFFENVYIPLGDAMDIIALTNSGINFILYCSMSQEFRRTFIKLFCSYSLCDRRSRRKSYIRTEIHNDQLETTLINMHSCSR